MPHRDQKDRRRASVADSEADHRGNPDDILEQIVDAPVPQDFVEDLGVLVVPQERISERVVEHIVVVPVQEVMGEGAEVAKLIPQGFTAGTGTDRRDEQVDSPEEESGQGMKLSAAGVGVTLAIPFVLSNATDNLAKEMAHDLEVNSNKTSPFGKEDTAKELQDDAAKTQDTLVDAVENAEVPRSSAQFSVLSYPFASSRSLTPALVWEPKQSTRTSILTTSVESKSTSVSVKRCDGTQSSEQVRQHSSESACTHGGRTEDRFGKE